MAVTDYVYQQETVLKKDFEAWLIAKMQAAGWQQVGSNPPQSPNDAAATRFYMMKGKRGTEETYVGINGIGVRSKNSIAYSMMMNIVPFLDYTPGAAGTNGTTSKGTTPFSNLTTGAGAAAFTWTISGVYNSTIYPAETPLNVRFCITPHNVSLFVRTPIFYNEKGNHLFFGLPDVLSKEKPTGATVMTGSYNGNGGNSAFYIADTPLNIPNSTVPFDTLSSYSLSPPRSPDVNGVFPFIIAYGGDTASGMRVRHPSVFFVKPGGLIDGDVIYYQGMTFEIMEPQGSMSGGFLSGYIAYRIN